jgi:hypothetical protein
MHWFRRRHWLHLQGSLGGLRYEGRFGVFELSGIGEAKRPLMLSATAGERARAFALQVWESEGGALLLSEGSTHGQNDRDLNR